MSTKKQIDRTVADVIDRIGIPAICEGLGGISYTTVASWRDRGRIPVDYWSRFLIVAHHFGVSDLTNDELVKMHTPVGVETLVSKEIREHSKAPA